MAYTPVPDVTTGDDWTADNHDTYIRDNFADHETRMLAQEVRTQALTIQKTFSQAVTAGPTQYFYSWDSGEVFDPQAWHDNSTNPTRFTLPAGSYLFMMTAAINYSSTPTSSSVQIGLRVDGTTSMLFIQMPYTNFIGGEQGGISGILTYTLASPGYVEVYTKNYTDKTYTAALTVFAIQRLV